MHKQAKYISLILSILAAVVLLVSGYAKAADAAYFSDVVWNTFHSPFMAIAAVAWIIVEVVLGLMLLLQWRQRLVALLTAIAIVGATGVYVYGAEVYGMSSCGCFGHIYALNMGLTGTIIRNCILLGVLIYIVVRPSSVRFRYPSVRSAVVIVGTGLAAFMSGYTMRGAMVLFARYQGMQGQVVSSTSLCDLALSADSSYLVFAFSFNCPYCQMAVGNVSLYEQSGLVDRVVGIAAADSAAEQRFLDVYRGAPFRYSTVTWREMNALVKDLPTTFLIRHDTIQYVWTGEVPPAIFFK